jgi:Mg2+-importing ATPase
LLERIELKVNVRRDAKVQEIPLYEVVPGDLILLDAGSAVPGDCLILEEKDIFVDESALTGETFPVEKQAGTFIGVHLGLQKLPSGFFLPLGLILVSYVFCSELTKRVFYKRIQQNFS